MQFDIPKDTEFLGQIFQAADSHIFEPCWNIVYKAAITIKEIL